MQILVNGRKEEFHGDTISHEQICIIANQPVWASVCYSGPRNGDSQRSGLTYPGKSVKVEDGMMFDCVVTGNA